MGICDQSTAAVMGGWDNRNQLGPRIDLLGRLFGTDKLPTLEEVLDDRSESFRRLLPEHAVMLDCTVPRAPLRVRARFALTPHR